MQPATSLAIPGTPRRVPPSGDGGTPVAKRPADISRDGGQAGPPMSADDMNSFVYSLYHKQVAMETWAVSINAMGSDHANRLDFAQMAHHEHTELLEKLGSWSVVSEGDTRRVMADVQANDDKLKAQVEAAHTALKTEFDKLKDMLENTTSAADGRIRDIQACLDGLAPDQSNALALAQQVVAQGQAITAQGSQISAQGNQIVSLGSRADAQGNAVQTAIE